MTKQNDSSERRADESGYNGWTNYETWCVKLWLDNSEADEAYWSDAAEEAIREAQGFNYDEDATEDQLHEAAIALAERLQRELYDEAEGLPSGNMYADLLNHSLGRVNWDEIAAAMIEDNK